MCRSCFYKSNQSCFLYSSCRFFSREIYFTLLNAPRAIYEVKKEQAVKNARIDQHDQCSTVFMPQEPTCFSIPGSPIGGCIGGQRVEGCLSIIKYTTPIYEVQYICNYGGGPDGGELPTDPDGGQTPCNYYTVYVGDRIDSYDAVASYSGKKDLVVIVRINTSSYDLTSMTLRIYQGSSPFPIYTASVSDASHISWSQSGYASYSSGNLRAELSIQDQNTNFFYNPPTSPAIVNSVAFF